MWESSMSIRNVVPIDPADFGIFYLISDYFLRQVELEEESEMIFGGQRMCSSVFIAIQTAGCNISV